MVLFTILEKENFKFILSQIFQNSRCKMQTYEAFTLSNKLLETWINSDPPSSATSVNVYFIVQYHVKPVLIHLNGWYLWQR